MTSLPEPNDEDRTKLSAYREYLVELYTKTQEEFDRTLLALSGGALGVSFAFVKDFLGTGNVVRKDLLFVSWCCWIVTLALTLISQYLASVTIGIALKKLDRQKWLDPDEPGGRLAKGVTVGTGAAGLFFLVGLLFMAHFVILNVR